MEGIIESVKLWNIYMWNNKFQIRSVIWVPNQLMLLALMGAVTKAD